MADAASPLAGALELVACAADLFGTTPRDILRPSKHTHIVHARWACFLALRIHGASYPRIGRRFGKDQSTARHGTLKALALMARDYVYADKVATLVALRDGEFLRARRDGGCKQHLPVLDHRQDEQKAVAHDR